MNIDLPLTLQAWPAGNVKHVLKNELESLTAGSLPLHEYTTQGGMVDDNNIAVSVFSVEELGDGLQAKVGVFFTEIVGGCNCHDDPVGENAYAELVLRINTGPV